MEVFSKVDSIVKDIMSFCSEFHYVNFNFVPRECNFRPDALANRGKCDNMVL